MLLQSLPHFLSCGSLSFMQSCSITEIMTHASSVSLKRMNIAEMEKRSGMTGNHRISCDVCHASTALNNIDCLRSSQPAAPRHDNSALMQHLLPTAPPDGSRQLHGSRILIGRGVCYPAAVCLARGKHALKPLAFHACEQSGFRGKRLNSNRP